jgi:uncharacterized membrane protein
MTHPSSPARSTSPRSAGVLGLLPVFAGLAVASTMALLLPEAKEAVPFVARILAILAASVVILGSAQVAVDHPPRALRFVRRRRTGRARRRRGLKPRLVGGVMLLLPVATSAAVAFILNRYLPRPSNGTEVITRLTAVTASSFVVLILAVAVVPALGHRDEDRSAEG